MSDAAAAEGEGPAIDSDPPLQDLPAVALARICRNLTLRDITALATTCRRLREVLPSVSHHAHPSGLFTTQTRDDTISALVFSPDGTRLAAASEWGVSYVFGADNGEIQLELDRGAVLTVKDLAWHPSGEHIATTNADDTVDMFNATDGALLLEAGGPDPHPGDEACSLDISPDGTLLAVGRASGTIDIYEMASNTHVRTLQGHNHEIVSVVFSRDGQVLVTSDEDTFTRIWVVATGGCQATIRHRSVIRSAISPDGRMIATTSLHTTSLWSAQTGEHITMFEWRAARAEPELEPWRTITWCVSFSPNGRYVAVGYDQATVRLYNVHTRRVVATFQPNFEDRAVGVTAVAFNRRGDRIAFGSGRGDVTVYDISRFS